MHRILLREVVIDAPDEVFVKTRAFWGSALLAEPRQVEEHPEFTGLVGPAAMSWVGLQNVGAAAARLHLDIETDDVDAEVQRLVTLGAEIVGQGRTWVVLKDPAGLLFCVVPHESPWFEERARVIP
ncbi:VOC family protein [Arthrobacter crusticola]|uniref:VOC family protein n=1 Tax=Arthrobacter crusticola TaxID=2547960 RepID=UPI0014046C98|nr:VOC family protein [Arthrobacter crusticola]